MSFLDSIQNQSKKHEFPFNHWEYYTALTDGAIEEIIKSAKNVVDDYKTNPSELSSDDVVTIHQDSPFLDDYLEGDRWKRVIKGNPFGSSKTENDK